ncbi:hypothetical protein L6164_033862 [Bauhinia variegata]|uniref:Uncharacterized protein n=1 Tax=Bauhinia variegata TaxID=167791 RepID=A0ACB9KT18_BAUVA|nr:hypothetical protein L6164_033862 [Bauhinia variegata]
MATTEGIADPKFPPADVDSELNPGKQNKVEVDPVSSEVAVSKEIKEEAEVNEKKKETEKREAIHTLKSAIIISGIIVAVAGAAFAIAKKLREK